MSTKSTVAGPVILLERPTWRIVRRQWENPQTGELRDELVIEHVDGKDAMGVQRWKTLGSKSAWSEWANIAECLMVDLLEREQRGDRN